jgi:hypothetical protein
MSTDITTHARAFRVDITATTEISVPAEKVWEALADTAAYPEWNPFVVRFGGDLRTGGRIVVDLKPGEGPAQTMRPRIVEHTAGSSFTWLGHIGLPGVLDGRHTFRVEPITATSSRLVQHEILSGVLVPLFRTMLTKDTPKAFVALNEALAARVTR